MSNGVKESTRSKPCPICGGTSWCFQSGGLWRCYRSTGPGPEYLDKRGSPYRVFTLDGAPTQSDEEEYELTTGAPLASVDERDRVYRDWLSRLALEARHRDNLQRRGLTAAHIAGNGCRTMPVRGRSKIAKELAEAYGADTLAGVPGWYVAEGDGRNYPTLAGSPGLLIPVRDPSGRIAALNVRVDDPDADGKYRWVSSRHHGGASPGTQPHVPLFSGDTSDIRLTEGALKADIATALSGMLTLGAAGLTPCTCRQYVREIGARTVRLALDADAAKNPHVARALQLAVAAYRKEGLTVLLETWEPALGKGIDDLLAAGHTPDLLEGKDIDRHVSALLRSSGADHGPSDEDAPPVGRTVRVRPVESREPKPDSRRSFLPKGIISAADLQIKEIPTARWVIPGLVPEGLFVLAGKPKGGKSILALQLASAVASYGYALGQHVTESGEALYLALEDTERRLKKRVEALVASGAWPRGLYFSTEWPRLDKHALTAFQEWMTEHPSTKFIVVDVFQKVRPQRRVNGDLYAEDYEVLTQLKSVADTYGLCMMVITHTRKAGTADDPLDAISGTTAIPGAADTIAILRRDTRSGDAMSLLYIKGRDMEETELALRFDGLCGWTLLGSADQHRFTAEERQVLDLLKRTGPLTPSAIAAQLDKNANTIKQRLYRMADRGSLVSHAGCYSLSTQTHERDVERARERVTGVDGVTDETGVTPVTDVTEGANGHKPVTGMSGGVTGDVTENGASHAYSQARNGVSAGTPVTSVTGLQGTDVFPFAAKEPDLSHCGGLLL